MGQVQNGHLYIRYRSNSQKKNQAEEWKSLQITSLCYSVAKSTLKTPLTFWNSRKPNMKNFNFVHLSSSSSPSSITQKLQCVQILSVSNDCSAYKDYSCLFWAVYELWLASYGLKTVSNTASKLSQTRFAFLLRMLLSFSCNNCVGMARMVRPHPDYWTRVLHVGEVTGSDEFAKN